MNPVSVRATESRRMARGPLRLLPQAAPAGWALTACSGNPEDSASWRREILPLCPRCDRLIREAGDKGRVLKATGERWYGGHRVGRSEAKGIGQRGQRQRK
jgi:uncharacterized C2H2 Zn-finger protein